MRRRFVLAVSSALLFLSVVLAPHHFSQELQTGTSEATNWPSSVLISEFYPCGLADDEYLVLSNSGSSAVNLRNWTVTDGEGLLRFVADVVVGAEDSLVISTNASSYLSAFGAEPDIWLGSPSLGELVSLKGTFRMGDSGDSLCLLSPVGNSVDFVVYGACSESSGAWTGPTCSAFRRGEVAKRIPLSNGFQDTDSSRDWMPFREFRYGYTEFEPFEIRLPAGAVTAFTSPDCALVFITEAVRSASASVKLCAYELSSSSLCRELLAARDRGVSVSALVDGTPAGGMSQAELACLSVIARAGVDTMILTGNLADARVRHVGPLHSKYMVIDGRQSILLSENFVESGLPRDTVMGNRGWGISVISEKLAGYLKTLFESDSRCDRPDIARWEDDARYAPAAVLPITGEPEHTEAALAPFTTTSDAVTRVFVSPDSSVVSPFLLEPLRASTTMLIEQFQVDLHWTTRWADSECISPLVDALTQSMLGGGATQLLMDSSWFNFERNSEVVSYLISVSGALGLKGECRLLDNRSPITVLHNKGAVLDGRLTLVSSNNWGYSAFARNRELAAIVDSVEVADYFARAFRMDWEPDTEPPVAVCGEDVTVSLGELVHLDASASSDDRAIVHWEWDLHSDGSVECEGRRFEFVAAQPGSYSVLLTVEDAWGNTCSDWLEVRVVVDEHTQDALPKLRLAAIAAIPLVCFGGAMFGMALARKKARSSRKLNHPDGD